MSILPVAVLPTRTVVYRPNLFNFIGGYTLVRYENVAGAFSLTTVTYSDVPTPPPVANNVFIQLEFVWRACFVIRSFDAERMDAFGDVVPRRRYGYYHSGYADLSTSLHYINFSKQLTQTYAGMVGDNGFASWVDNFPPPLPLLPGIFRCTFNTGTESQSREFGTLLKGELARGVIADVFISAVHTWKFNSVGTDWIAVDV